MATWPVPGTWQLTKAKGEARLNVTPFDRPLAPAEYHAVEAEGQRLLTFLEPRTERRHVAVHNSVET